MKKTKICLQIIGVMLFASTLIFPSGNVNNYELGAAMYRKLGWSPTSVNHWHTGIFNYFEYKQSNSYGYLYYTEAEGIGHETHTEPESEFISTSNYVSNLSSLKTDLRNNFRSGKSYYGTYSTTTTPNNRSSIVTTARTIGINAIEYTWQDMLISDGYWDGTINSIAEIRCAGVVEYSYEKNGVMVSNDNNISYSGSSHLNIHNDLHTWGYNWPELCPKIQAGESCSYYSPSSGTSHSEFEPLASANPVLWPFSTSQNSDNIQLNFTISDNASVKTYVLIQVKKINESTWHTLIDKNNNKWKFKAVDLTEWNGNYQYDNFHIPWIGKYDGGVYNSNDHNFDIKITVIDQGANHTSTYNLSFSGNIPPVNVSISGPHWLAFKQTGTWTANLNYGSGDVTYKWYKSTNGGSSWGGVIGTSPTFTTTMLNDDFMLRCDVHDTQTGEDDSDTHSVINDDMPKQNTNKTKVDIKPEEYGLSANYPNPFNPTTTIKYQLKENGFVSLKVFDVLGKEVASLVNENKSAGFYETVFDANNLPSGFYVYKLTVNDFVSTKKMLLTK